MRVYVRNLTGVPLRCIATLVDADGVQPGIHLYVIGAHGLRTDMRGRFVKMPGEELSDTVLPPSSHHRIRRFLVAEVRVALPSFFHDEFACKWHGAEGRYGESEIIIDDLLQ